MLIETIPACSRWMRSFTNCASTSSGLNCGRWDYIFSFVKKSATGGIAAVLPDRTQVRWTSRFMPRLHAFRVHSSVSPPRRVRDGRNGGANSGPKTIPRPTPTALAKVGSTRHARPPTAMTARGSRIPALVPIAREAFAAHMNGANQLDRAARRRASHRRDILQAPTRNGDGEGLRSNIHVGIQYLEAWLRGSGRGAALRI